MLDIEKINRIIPESKKRICDLFTNYENRVSNYLQKAKESSRIRNNAHFRDLMENVKSEAEFIELMNKVASLNKKDNKNRIYNT